VENIEADDKGDDRLTTSFAASTTVVFVDRAE